MTIWCQETHYGDKLGPAPISGPLIPTQLRDLFLTDRTVGNVNGTDAEPGPGTRAVTDVEGVIQIVNDWLRGGGQPASPVWGESRLVWQSHARKPGRCLGMLISVEDASHDLVFGLATADNIADPRIDGHGWYHMNGALVMACPGASPVLIGADVNTIRPSLYLVWIVENVRGAVLLLSTFSNDSGGGMGGPLPIPAFPTARIIYACNNGTTTPLYPMISYYDEGAPYFLGHGIKDVRVFDVTSWVGLDYPLAAFVDEFERADTINGIANGWTAYNGPWGIDTGTAYCSAGGGGTNLCQHETGLADGLFQWDIYIPSGAIPTFGCILRGDDSKNHIRFTNNNTTNQWHLQAFTADAYHDSIMAGAYAWNASTWYRIAVHVKGNQYLCFVNDVQLQAGYLTDIGNHYLTNTKMGMSSWGANLTLMRYDNVAAMPHTITLPTELQHGATPPIVAGTTTLATDTFTDANGTALAAHMAELGGAWTEHISPWTIQANRAIVTLGAGDQGVVTQSLGVHNVECQVEVITPGAWNANEAMFSGMTILTDVNNWVSVRLVNWIAHTCEIEIVRTVAGAASVDHKVQMGLGIYALNSTYTLKVQVIDDLILIFLDGLPRESYILPASVVGATHFGLYRYGGDSGCVFDNWSVKEL